jgi:putative colanic acid biosynthesis acetyltransferase WcaB
VNERNKSEEDLNHPMNHFIAYTFQDWQINRDTSTKSRLILLMFRSTQFLQRLPGPFSIVAIAYRLLYQVLVEWLLGVELPWDTQVGPNLKLHHGVALVVNHKAVIGANCILRHATTIGNKKLSDGTDSGSPTIGDNVDIGSNSVILGAISVGDRAVIGAGCVVVKSVPPGAVVVGNPAQVIRILDTFTHSSEESHKVESDLEFVSVPHPSQIKSG